MLYILLLSYKNHYKAKLIRLQCYEGIKASKVLYEINVPKQNLYQNILRDKIIKDVENCSYSDAIKYISKKVNFFSSDFIIPRPILKSLFATEPNVLLIDEIDKADLEIESFLLEPLSDYSLSIPEFGTIYAKIKPIVVITSNNQRELSGALKRRCVYLHIGYPSIELERDILERKAKVPKEFAEAVAHLTYNMRHDLELYQNPSISESLDWANLLYNHLGVTDISHNFKTQLLMTANLLCKNEKDLEEVQKLISNTVS